MKPTEMMKAARRAGVPILAFPTSDQYALVKTLAKALPATAPFVGWDSVRGFTELNKLGRDAIKAAVGTASPEDCNQPDFAFGTVARSFQAETVIAVFNAHRYLKDDGWAQVAQAFAILRTEFPSNHRKLLLLGPALTVPTELRHDVVICDDPLPGDDEIATIIERVHKGAGAELPDVAKITAIGRGLSAFEVEQTLALAMTKVEGKTTLDVTEAWRQKQVAVGQVNGLRMELGGPTLDDFIGYGAVAEYAKRLWSGPSKPRVVVVFDEIEKQMAGAFGEANDGGVSKDSFSTILKWMNDDDHDGQVNIGLGGTGKTLYATALGATFDIPTVHFDMGAMRGELVGQSEKMIREAVKTITAIAGKGGAYIVATCNGLGKMPPEMKRRFHSGFWYFELPNQAARTAMWKHYAKRFGITLPKAITWDAGWTGAEIRNCCSKAWKLSCTVDEARQYIVPVAISDPQAVTRLREQAEGRLIDATLGGYYDKKAALVTDGSRRMEMEDGQ